MCGVYAYDTLIRAYLAIERMKKYVLQGNAGRMEKV